MPAFRSAAADGVEDLERRHQLAVAIDADLQPPAAAGLDPLRELDRARAERREVRRPGGHEAPFESARIRRARRRPGLAAARGNRRGGGTGTQAPDHVTSLHDSAPRNCGRY